MHNKKPPVSCHCERAATECERRDPKGLYKKAREGIISNFTGISDPYEIPSNPEIIVDTETQTVEESLEQIMGFLKENEYI